MILTDVHFNLKAGELIYIVGKSGVGKSAFLKSIIGQTQFEGEIITLGIDISKMNKYDMQFLSNNVGVLIDKIDNDGMKHSKSVLDNIVANLKNPTEDYLNAQLFYWELPYKRNKYLYQLSRGETEIVNIARALINSPSILLADEPFMNNDPNSVDILMQKLLTIVQKKNLAVLFVTNNYSIIQKYPSKVVRIENGHLRNINFFT